MCINKECPVINQELGLCSDCAWEILEGSDIPYEYHPRIISLLFEKEIE